MTQAAAQAQVLTTDIVTFEDVYVRFTAEEWDLLDEGDKRLFNDVTLDTFLLAASVGLKICKYGEITAAQLVTEPRVNIAPAMTDMLQESSGPGYGHIVPGENASSEHDVSRKESQVRALKVEPSIQKSHQCDMCDPILKNILHLAGQQGISPGQQPYPCRSCGRAFWVNVNPDSRVDSEYREAFSHEDANNEHQNMVMGEASHKCNECGNLFCNISSLNIHQKVHTRVMPYKCTYCEKSFARKCNLVQHQNWHTAEKPYKCNECGEVFSLRIMFRKHMKTHSKEKPFFCSACGEILRHKDALAEHKNTHLEIKFYMCDECGKCFSHTSYLNLHKRSHHAARFYTCSECGEVCITNSSLNQHMKIHTTARPMGEVNVGEPTENAPTSLDI